MRRRTMLYKIFLILTVIGCLSALGISAERRVIKRRDILKSVTRAIKCARDSVADQGMTLGEALCRCGAKENKMFAMFGDALKKNPKMKAAKIVDITAENGCTDMDLLTAADREVIAGFMEGMFSAVSREEIKAVCGRYCAETAELIREIDGVLLKKARLKKVMCILGGIALGIIFV